MRFAGVSCGSSCGDEEIEVVCRCHEGVCVRQADVINTLSISGVCDAPRGAVLFVFGRFSCILRCVMWVGELSGFA